MMSSQILRLKNSKFVKNTAILTLGVAIAQIIPILAYPVLSRIYTPEDFGLLAPITSIIAILGIVVTLKYENAILITKSQHDCSSLIIGIFIISFSFLSVIELLIILFSEQFSILLNNHSLKNWLWVCPISAGCVVLFNCFNEWCIRNGRFKALSINKIVNGISLPGGKLIFSGVIFRSFGLIIGDLLGHIITGASCLIRMFRTDKNIFKGFSKNEIKQMLRRYSDCPKFILPGQLLNKIAYELPVFVIMAQFSAEIVGYYSMSMMVLALPTIVIGRSIGDTFRKTAADLYLKSGNFTKFWIRIVSFAMALSIVGFSILALIAPQLFSFVLGEEWSVSAEYCRILSPMLAVSFVSQIVSYVYIIVEKMKTLLFWQMFYFLSTIIGICIGAFFYKTIEATLCGLVIGRSIAHITNILNTYRLSSYKKNVE